jgi:hypothetical protein
MIYAWKKKKKISQVSTHGQVLALPNTDLRASLDPSQSLDSSQSFNLIHPSSLTMGSRLGITFPFFLLHIFQPIWHNNHWQTNWPFLMSLWQMVLVILTSIACYMQTKDFPNKMLYKVAFEHIWNCYVCVIVWIEVDNMNWRTIFDIWRNNKDSWVVWIGEQFLTFIIITKIAELYGLEAWDFCVCVFFPCLYDHQILPCNFKSYICIYLVFTLLELNVDNSNFAHAVVHLRQMRIVNLFSIQELIVLKFFLLLLLRCVFVSIGLVCKKIWEVLF